jgi:hypothetical protein
MTSITVKQIASYCLLVDPGDGLSIVQAWPLRALRACVRKAVG